MNELLSYQLITEKMQSLANRYTHSYHGSTYGYYADNVKLDLKENKVFFHMRCSDGIALGGNKWISFDVKYLTNDSGLEAEAKTARENEHKSRDEISNKIRELERSPTWIEWKALKDKEYYNRGQGGVIIGQPSYYSPPYFNFHT